MTELLSIPVKQKFCSNCARFFSCGITETNGGCWYNQFPPIFPMNTDIDCLCPDCLKAATIEKINEYVNTLTPAEALSNKAKDLPKTNKLIEEIDYYLENGFYVFTSWYHLKRGTCCQNGCRHCPYGYTK